jgi:hypothetical protein
MESVKSKTDITQQHGCWKLPLQHKNLIWVLILLSITKIQIYIGKLMHMDKNLFTIVSSYGCHVCFLECNMLKLFCMTLQEKQTTYTRTWPACSRFKGSSFPYSILAVFLGPMPGMFMETTLVILA